MQLSDSGLIPKVIEEEIDINIKELNTDDKLGVMLIGWGGNNGTTFTAGILASQLGVNWNTKEGEQNVKWFGSISQMGSVHIGYDDKQIPHSKLFKDMIKMVDINKICIGGWDICKDNLYKSTIKNQVLDYNLQQELKGLIEHKIPLPGIYYPDFIATNQIVRADNIINTPLTTKFQDLQVIINDINKFKQSCDLDKVVVLWTASTERFTTGKWANKEELLEAIKNSDSEISPSIIYAVASIMTGSVFLNGSPQNTLVPSIIDLANSYKTFVGGEDFKTGQTKIKSVLADFLASSGIKPLSIVSYNHLGNNDGKNLSEDPQFKSKEITKKNVIDDIIEDNPSLFNGDKPDHCVVIKYVPAVGDSKRAMDEYYSQLFLSGKQTIAIHNTCEDSLLAAPLMLDIILFAELFTRVTIKKDGKVTPFSSILSLLSFFFKAPIVKDNEPLINAFFKQRYGLENFFRVATGLPPLDHLNLHNRI
jgi:myo-inositol-1-phosphate synthase